MLENYETDDTYTLVQIQKFEDWLDDNIGTETERNSSDNDCYYLIISDLTKKEIAMCMQYETECGK